MGDGENVALQSESDPAGSSELWIWNGREERERGMMDMDGSEAPPRKVVSIKDDG